MRRQETPPEMLQNIAEFRPNEANEFFSIEPLYGPGVYSASNRSGYQKQKKKVSGE
jgi:hypothetical protein